MYVEKFKGFTVMAANQQVVKTASFLQNTQQSNDRASGKKFQLSNRKASLYLGGAGEAQEAALPTAEQ